MLLNVQPIGWAYSPRRRSHGLWFQLLPHADRPLHWKRGGGDKKKKESSAECCVLLPGCQSRFLSSSIRVYRKRSLGGRKAGLCVCFRGFWHFVIDIESICFHKPVSGVSVSPFLVCLSNVHVIVRPLRLKKEKKKHTQPKNFFSPPACLREGIWKGSTTPLLDPLLASWCYVTSMSLSVFVVLFVKMMLWNAVAKWI